MAQLQVTVFNFLNYKEYINKILELRGESKKGQRSKFATHIGCQPAYISQVLNGNMNLSPEQAQATNEFFGHSQMESHYFLNLVLLSRAGSKALRNYYEKEIKKIVKDHHLLQNRFTSNRILTEVDQSRYYSYWYYAAIHVIISLGTKMTKETIAKTLGLSLKLVSEVIEFLLQVNLLKYDGNQLTQGEVSLYVGAESQFINKHHINWKIKAIQSLEQVKQSDLHYTGVITCSNQDLNHIREILIEAIKKTRETVRQSKDELLYVYSLDLFSPVE